MPPDHHPSAQDLADYITGAGAPGLGFLLACHLKRCSLCAANVQGLAAPSPVIDTSPRGPWRRLASGGEVMRVRRVSGLGEAVYYLRGAPDELLGFPRELEVAELLVVEGALSAGEAAYAAGDFVSLERAAPFDAARAGPGEGCLLLITTDDNLRGGGPIGAEDEPA